MRKAARKSDTSRPWAPFGQLVESLGEVVLAVIERDSAGVRLVANNANGSGWNGDTPWRVTEGLAIGSDTLSEAYRFGRIGDLSGAPNGNIAVIDRLAGVVRVFDAAGRHPWVANDDDGVLVLERVAVATNHQGDRGAGRDRP